MASKPREPKLIQCDTHGPRTGYAICRHIVDQGKPVTFVSHPNPSLLGLHATIGSIGCALGADGHTARDLILVCRDCAEAKGWTKVLS